MNKLPIVILVSGAGTNLKAIIEQCQNIEITAIISNNPEAKAINIIKETKSSIPYIVDSSPNFRSNEEYDNRLIKYINMRSAELIVLAGYMKILTSVFIKQFERKIINIHPSLLPKYKGLNTHERVIKNGEPYHGITIHYVTEKLDSGPIILQRKIDVLPTYTVKSLKNKIHEIEHLWYPAVIDSIAAEKLINSSLNYI